MVTQLVYTTFINNNRTWFHLWWEKHFCKTSKSLIIYYESDCLQTFILFLIFLLTDKLVKTSHIYARILFAFAKNILKQTWNTFNTKLQAQWKDPKSSYQVRQILGLLLALNGSNFRLKQCERHLNCLICQRNKVWRRVRRVRIKKQFSEKITHKVSVTNSGFDVK